MLDNLKKLTSEMDVKTHFVREVAISYNLNHTYVLQNWFQNKWKIPQKEIEPIIKMAQSYLFEQTTRKRKLLIETGYNG